MTTQGAAITEWVNNVVDDEGRPVGLTEIYLRAPADIRREDDEIAFVYADGSEFVTSLADDDEWDELQRFRGEGA